MRKNFGIFFLVILIVVGCSNTGEKKESKLAILKSTNPSPIAIDDKQKNEFVRNIKDDISSFPEIYDVAVVKGEKVTLVAYKVKHLHRFKMKKIESNMNKLLEKKYPKENFTVSSDYKIFLEAVRLKERMKSKDISDKKSEKRLKQIINMANEMT